MPIPDEQVRLHRELNTVIAQALGEPERVAILRALAEAATPLSVDALAASSGLDASSLANPLADLVAANILISTDGPGSSYQFAPSRLARTLRAMLGSTISVSAALPADSGTLDAILDQMADGVALFDRSGRLVRLNPAGVRITRRTMRQGEPMDERLARFQIRQVNGAVMPIEDSPSGRALRGEVVTHMECLIDGQHGPETFLRYSAAPLREEDGTIQGAIVIFEDITEQRRLSHEEARQRTLVAAMIEHAFAGTALFDVSDAFRCVLHNGNFLRMMESDSLVRDNIVGMPLEDMFSGETYARVRAIFEQVRATGDSYLNNEFSATWPSDERRWYRWRLTPLRDEDGNITGLLNVIIEITELVTAREASRRHANELTAIIEAMPEAVMLVDHDGQIVLINGAAERILGHKIPTETPVNRFREVFHTYSADGRRLESHEIPIVRALNGETVVSEEMAYQRPDGSRIDLLTSSAPVDLDDSGQSDGAVAIFQDISRIKELERQRDDFLGIAAHELRTPLATILATLQAFMRRMRRRPDGQAVSDQTISPEALSSGMERMYRQAQRLNKLVSDLLDSTRIRTGKLIYDLEPCDMVTVVRDAVTGQIAANPGRTITLTVPEQPVTVMGDAFRLSQVVDNLVANALKYSTDDMPVAVSLAVDDDIASLRVTDKGIGIPPEHIEHLFERFYRVPGIDVQSGAGVGLGLGLHITRSVVERHGGRIEVRSARGKGSTFSVAVPLLQQPDHGAE